MRYHRGFAEEARLIDAHRSIAGTIFVFRASLQNKAGTIGQA